MALIVQKYGGTSVGSPDRIMNVARRAIAYQKKGDQVVVVVSAMSGETDRLIQLAHAVNETPDRRELDMLVSTGEQVSIALLAMAIKKLGSDAISMTGGQVGILTDRAFTKAKIENIETKPILNHLKKKKIVIVAGFQGVDPEGNITTLGRGGSDTTAVAIAAALKADLCEIYTDVDGVYTADPRVVPDARRLETISLAEVLELASTGAKVLHHRSVIFAMKYNVKLVVKSSFEKALINNIGTLCIKENKSMENIVVTGVSAKKDEARITVTNLPDRPGVAAKLFSDLSDRNIGVNMIVQSSSRKEVNDISFTVQKNDLSEAIAVTEKMAKSFKAGEVSVDKDIAIVSIVGIGMKAHSGVASKMFQILAKEGINLQMISTSEIKISAVIDSTEIDKAVKALHKGFELHKLKR
jgi:aspartate kinase